MKMVTSGTKMEDGQLHILRTYICYSQCVKPGNMYNA